MTKLNTKSASPIALTLAFNAAATAAFMAKEPNAVKFRIETRDGQLFVRPTDRIKGRHVLPAFDKIPAGPKDTIKVHLTEADVESLGYKLEVGTKAGLLEDKYGWFQVLEGDAAGIDGAKMTVHKAPGARSAAKAEDQTETAAAEGDQAGETEQAPEENVAA